MSATPNRTDRLYELLPVIYRLRDAEKGYPLRDLLRVISEQVNLVEDDIAQLYENWFIETAADWVVPYLADLIGYRPVHPTGDLTQAEITARNRVLVPRREVANTLADRRRKGTLPLLELLANQVADWPARAVEEFKLLGWTQNLNHPHCRGQRARLADLRNANRLDLVDGPFDPLAHSVEVRRIVSHRSQGRYNIPSVALYAWRLQAYSVTRTSAYCIDAARNFYTFSVLGNNTPLFTRPQAEASPTQIAGELNVPTPIRRRALAADRSAYYGEGRSLAVWANWLDYSPDVPLPPEVIVPADLSDWYYRPKPGTVAVDPALGRLAFPPDQLPEKQVRVSYHYGFSADVGSGEYARSLPQPAEFQLYTVGERGAFQRLAEAVAAWRQAQPVNAIIEIVDSGVYVEQIQLDLAPNQNLHVRAANRVRPVLRLLDWQTDLPDALSVRLSPASRLTLDGLLITGRGVSLSPLPPPSPAANTDVATTTTKPASDSDCVPQVTIRHCTLVPGWAVQADCAPVSPNKPSLEVLQVRARLRIDHSIVGAITIEEDEVNTDPIPVEITDSLLDATGPKREALGAAGRHAHAVVTLRRCTVFGIIQTHAVALAENCLFNDCVHVARRQIGCMRFCYVPVQCRTPRRFHCQPDLVRAAAAEALRQEAAARNQPAPSDTEIATAQALEAERVRPQYASERYGTPDYAQLTRHCAEEIRRGADDESEMGVFHNLFQPQRLDNLQARLAEYTPANMEAGAVLVT